MKTKDSKEKRIRTWLLSGGTMTKIVALELFGHNNLGDIVYKMNKKEPGLIDKMWGISANSRYAIYGLASVIKKHRLSLLNKSK